MTTMSNILAKSMTMTRSFGGRWLPGCTARRQALHRDERGFESLQTVMILAVAAVALLAIRHYWPWWKEFLDQAVEVFLEN
ncbi:hypothetical protein OAS39_10275 [Pirellulales bacterium]|nr:hypothetical protein [Pirellulales bacterium]